MSHHLAIYCSLLILDTFDKWLAELIAFQFIEGRLFQQISPSFLTE